MDADVRSERRADAGKSLAAVVLGNDAVAAIRPCAPSQLARACVAAGFDVIVPPSWGDELVAAAYLHELADRLEYAVAPCACPLVRSMLERPGTNSAVACALAAAPPVAAARYVRATYGELVLITYVGDCPSASDPAIDARFSPAGFLASLNRQGISVEDQPPETVPAEGDRWRRHRSTPGGLPARRYLARPPVNRVLRDGDDHSLTDTLPVARSNMVVDFSIAANCFCSGAGANLDDHEPPRSQTPIVVAPNGLDLSPALSAPRVRPTLRARPDAGSEPRATSADTPASPTEVHAIPEVARHAPRPAPAIATALETIPPRSTRRRIAMLASVPVIVMAVATALGIAVYRVSSSATPDSRRPLVEPLIATDSNAARMPDSSMGYVPNPALDSTTARRDSAAESSTRRVEAPQVVPGWLPQGRPRFTPDSTAGRRP